jgi:hypothetical protein
MKHDDAGAGHGKGADCASLYDATCSDDTCLEIGGRGDFHSVRHRPPLGRGIVAVAQRIAATNIALAP